MLTLPVVLHWCETCSLTLREEHRLRIFENRVLRRIFESKKDEGSRGWRKRHNEELHNLCSSSSIIRIIKMDWIDMAQDTDQWRALANTAVNLRAP
jgi:hypothetical protein